MKKYEYKTLWIPSWRSLAGELEGYGAAGWLLCVVSPTGVDGNVWIILVREIGQ